MCKGARGGGGLEEGPKETGGSGGRREPHCRMQQHLFSDSVPQDPNFVGHLRQYCAKGFV